MKTEKVNYKKRNSKFKCFFAQLPGVTSITMATELTNESPKITDYTIKFNGKPTTTKGIVGNSVEKREDIGLVSKGKDFVYLYDI